MAVATSLGFGGGALLTGLALLASPSAGPVSYPLLALATAVCLLLVPGMRGGAPVGGPLLRPPCFPKGTIPVTLAIALAWAVTGVVISLLPAQLARNGLSSWAGPALFLVNGAGISIQPMVRKMDPRHALLCGWQGAWSRRMGPATA